MAFQKWFTSRFCASSGECLGSFDAEAVLCGANFSPDLSKAVRGDEGSTTWLWLWAMAMGYGCFYQNHGIAGIASSNLGFPGVCSLFDDQYLG